MSQKARSFNTKYVIKAKGVSRGNPEEPTHQERIIENFLRATIQAMRWQYKTLDIRFEVIEEDI